jgi:Fe-S-cluster containining protein
MPDPNQKAMTTCRRCGTCCQKGGPALHLEDRESVETGTIALAALFTIRRYEPAFDNVIGRISPARTDIIKIKPCTPGRSACRFYRHQPPGCSIYVQRPLECRVLQCWDTRQIENVYQRDRLTRQHLLKGHKDIWDLIAEHERHCDYRKMSSMAEALQQDKKNQAAIDALLFMLRYDQSLRKTVHDQTRLSPDLFDFLFGRPMTATLPRFNLKLIQHSAPDSYTITPLVSR